MCILRSTVHVRMARGVLCTHVVYPTVYVCTNVVCLPLVVQVWRLFQTGRCRERPHTMKVSLNICRGDQWFEEWHYCLWYDGFGSEIASLPSLFKHTLMYIHISVLHLPMYLVTIRHCPYTLHTYVYVYLFSTCMCACQMRNKGLHIVIWMIEGTIVTVYNNKYLVWCIFGPPFHLYVVERRRRERINELTRSLAKLIPACQKETSTSGKVGSVSLRFNIHTHRQTDVHLYVRTWYYRRLNHGIT